jgi:hypothetical protein
MICSMATALRPGLTAPGMRATTRRAKSTVEGPTFGQMGQSTLATGSTIRSMGRVSIPG